MFGLFGKCVRWRETTGRQLHTFTLTHIKGENVENCELSLSDATDGRRSRGLDAFRICYLTYWKNGGAATGRKAINAGAAESR